MHFITNLLPTFEHMGLWGYWVVLLVSILESLAFIGTLIPGAIVIVFVGFLSAQDYFDLADLIWFASIGAIIGDGISYYLGTKGTRLFKHENKILKLGHLDKGKKFFEKHGNKSVFFARFIGILRPIIPFVAGLSKMNKKSFLFWNILSAFFWSSFYLLLGYFFGGTLLTVVEAWSSRLVIFLALLFVLGFILWSLVKRSHRFFAFIKSILVSIKDAILENSYIKGFINKYPKQVNFLVKRFDRNSFEGLPLTILCIAFVYVFFLFVGVVQNVLTSDIIISLDVNLENLLYTFRDAELIKIFIWITLLGQMKIVISVILILSIILWLYKKRIYIYTLWLTVIGSETFSYLGKILVNRSRPGENIPFYKEISLSFPSGHATIAVALYGFIIYILWRNLKLWKTRTTALFIGLITIILIGISRLYLGVHFLSDVLGGYLVGLLWLIVGITITEWYLSSHKSEKTVYSSRRIKYISAGLIICEAMFYTVYAYTYRPMINTYQQTIITQTVANPIDIFSQKDNLPKFTEGIIGQVQEPISFIIVSSNDESLKNDFEKSGWYRADSVDLNSLLKASKSAFFKQSYLTAPVTPSFWNSKVHNFAFEKPTNINIVNERHHVRFWKTDIQIQDGKFIYVGTASFDKGIKWAITHRIKPDIDTEREFLFNDLQKAGVIEIFQEEQFVAPTLGQNLSGDQFFTDGKAYILYLK